MKRDHEKVKDKERRERNMWERMTGRNKWWKKRKFKESAIIRVEKARASVNT